MDGSAELQDVDLPQTGEHVFVLMQIRITSISAADKNGTDGIAGLQDSELRQIGEHFLTHASRHSIKLVRSADSAGLHSTSELHDADSSNHRRKCLAPHFNTNIESTWRGNRWLVKLQEAQGEHPLPAGIPGRLRS